MHPPATNKPWFRQLYLLVGVAVVAGVLVGHFWPGTGRSMKPLGDGFVKLVRMLIGPIVFCTVVQGVASMAGLRQLGRVGAKALLYFEGVSTLALLIGLGVVNVLKPGAGFNIDSTTLDPAVSQAYARKAHAMSAVDFTLNMIPDTLVSAFVSGELLQVLLVAILVAFALCAMGERGRPVLHAVGHISSVLFGVMGVVVKAAPVGAFGAMAFTIGSYGVGSLNRLLALMAGFYVTSALFVFVVLGLIARFSGFSILRFLNHIREELLLVLGTSSSETALPGMITKMRRLGCRDSTVGLVIPTGYSFNLDGTNIYMAMAVLFLAQATNTPLDLRQQVGVLLVAMVTSKGASGVTGAGFITLAATLSAVPCIPIESLAILVGIDRFMSECRAVCNLIGNGVATVVVSRWEGEISAAELAANLRNPPAPPASE